MWRESDSSDGFEALSSECEDPAELRLSSLLKTLFIISSLNKYANMLHDRSSLIVTSAVLVQILWTPMSYLIRQGVDLDVICVARGS